LGVAQVSTGGCADRDGAEPVNQRLGIRFGDRKFDWMWRHARPGPELVKRRHPDYPGIARPFELSSSAFRDLRDESTSRALAEVESSPLRRPAIN